MLIVIVIIRIISIATLPRLTGYMARTRDLQRHMDLRNIAAAIQTYVDNKWTFPQLWENHTDKQYMSELVGINEYISHVPKDPSNTRVGNIITVYDHRRIFAEPWLKKWEYLYISTRKSSASEKADDALLFSKVETPEGANYIAYKNHLVMIEDISQLGGLFY